MHQRIITPGLRIGAGRCFSGVGVGVYPQVDHVVLEVLKLCKYPAVPVLLFLVQVVQFPHNYIKGVLQGKYVHPAAAAFRFSLYPEVRVYQYEGFKGQVFKLQVPGGVIYRDIPYVYNAVLFEPLVGIVIVKVGNPFRLGAPASVLSYVMPGRCAGYPSQVHRQPQLFELAGDI